MDVIRAATLKRGKPDESLSNRIKLKKVLGLTVCSNAALDVSPTTGVLAYPAGCTVVLFNPKRLSQAFLLNTSRKAVTAIAYSRCGRYIATGECGINPSIKVWELEASGQAPETGSNTAGVVVAEFTGHKNAVSCVAFSPNGKYLVSVGSQNDMIVNVFDWKSNVKIASNKVSAKVVAVSFSEDGSYFVTVGNRHVKFWYLEGSTKYKDTTPLMGRSAILGDFRNNDFCAVACGKGVNAQSTYSIIRSGHLVEFNSRRLLDKWVDCRTTSANCITVNAEVILVGCAESIIRVFNAETLTYVTTLPRTHYLGVDVSQGVHINHVMTVPPNAKFPDTIACVFDEARAKVSCIYNDHSLYIWDLKDIRRVGKSYSFLYHSACIWGVETVPFDYTTRIPGSPLPVESFLTCSSDDTIRVWDLDGASAAEGNEVYRTNIYSRDLLKVAYIDDELKYIKDKDNSLSTSNEKGAASSFDGRNGVRCTKISPDRSHLASGDRSGNIRIYSLANMKLITTIEAHDSEVLCLEYTNERIDRKLLGSASRDRLIHVFDVENGYNILQTLDDHSSSITSIRFIGQGMAFQMVSCGADKAIIFRAFQNNQFQRGNHCNGKNTLYDMEVDSNSKHILLACQDRNIRVFGTQNAKQTKTFKGSHSDEGCLIKLTLDLSGIYVATSCTDKTLSVYDYYSNECMARMYGHSELVTGLKFTNDCKHLISASGDGCIFIWQVPHDMVVTMQARLSQQALRSGMQPPLTPQGNVNQRPMSIAVENPTRSLGIRSPVERDGFNSPILSEDTPIAPGYKLSDVGQLPQWAKRKAEESSVAASPPTTTSLANVNSQGQKPRGRWALKGDLDLDLRNIVDTAASSPSKDTYMSTYLSEDSSIDSGVENRRRRSEVAKGGSGGGGGGKGMNSESNTEHDGDVEDISDGERTSSEHGMMFYPDGGTPGTPTDFTVNEMNADELRKSIRRSKMEKQGMPLTYIQNALLSSAGTGTGTSDDEDEASTPSGDNGDRSLASTLGGSVENLPLQTTNSFLNTIDGGLSDRERGGFSSVGRKSISAKHNNHGPGSGSAAKEEITKTYTSSKKEELMKVINAAKQQLDNVGYRNRLRGSQSTMDLSQQKHLEQRLDRRQLSGHANSPFLSISSEESSIRRACSLSDLSIGKGLKTPTKSGNSRLSMGLSNRSQLKRSSMSGSVGMLNQAVSDMTNESESDQDGRKPTQKANGGSVGAALRSSNSNLRRRGLQNSGNLFNQDDSSSEETAAKAAANQVANVKPAVPPRPRSILTDNSKKHNNLSSGNNLNSSSSSNNAKNSRSSVGEQYAMDLMPSKEADLSNEKLTPQLCSGIINQLRVTIQSVLQLHERLREESGGGGGDDGGDSNNFLTMRSELENAVMMTQNMLTNITNNNSSQNGDNRPEAATRNSVSFNLPPEHGSSGGGSAGSADYRQMYDTCSDILSSFQKHVNNR